MNPVDISLYGIIDPNRTRGRDLVELTVAAAEGGITLLQYRDKLADTRTLVANAQAINQALAPYNIPLLINDRIDVALAVGAAGVHVGQSDMRPVDARRLLGDEAIIGLTVKNEGHAKGAPLDLLDYVCMGGVYNTLSKENPTSIGVDGWSKIASYFRKTRPGFPVGAIAGIDQNNASEILQAGADGVAIISAIFMAEDVKAATAELKSIVGDYKS